MGVRTKTRPHVFLSPVRECDLIFASGLQILHLNLLLDGGRGPTGPKASVPTQPMARPGTAGSQNRRAKFRLGWPCLLTRRGRSTTALSRTKAISATMDAENKPPETQLGGVSGLRRSEGG